MVEKLKSIKKLCLSLVFRNRLERCRLQTLQDPENPFLHERLGDINMLMGESIKAVAEFRTSIALGNTESAVVLSLAKAYLAIGQTELTVVLCDRIGTDGRSAADDIKKARNLAAKAKLTKPRSLTVLDHNRYYRLKSLADHITKLYGYDDISVLDVGGGDGALALFLTNARYVLAEPTVNGISAGFFKEKSFDIVVACHVLEHIPSEKRYDFLEQLSSRARTYVLLLNPFYHPESHVKERLQLILEITGSPWAKEHLDCTLPNLREIEEFAANRGYKIKISANGSLPLALAFVFLEHYAEKAGQQQELKRINHLFNTAFYKAFGETDIPTAFLAEISVNQTGKQL
jgi:hypothetical protein